MIVNTTLKITFNLFKLESFVQPNISSTMPGKHWQVLSTQLTVWASFISGMHSSRVVQTSPRRADLTHLDPKPC